MGSNEGSEGYDLVQVCSMAKKGDREKKSLGMNLEEAIRAAVYSMKEAIRAAAYSMKKPHSSPSLLLPIEQSIIAVEAG